MSFGKRSVLILLFLLLCSALVLCGLAAAEYYTRSVGFGDDTPPIRLERDEADGGPRLHLHTLGIEKTYDLQPLVGFWESVKQFINENFGRGRNGSFVVPGGFLCRKM